MAPARSHGWAPFTLWTTIHVVMHGRCAKCMFDNGHELSVQRSINGRVLQTSSLDAVLSCCAGPDGQKVRLIAVPEFRKTGVAVLLDLDTLEPQPLHFDACLT